MTISLLLFIIGIVLLYVGAESLVRGAIRFATALSLKPVIIGLTVVAFVTSAPEFVVSLRAAVADSSDIAVGNVVGSNIANIGLILGIAALIYPVTVSSGITAVYYPVMLISTLVFYAFSFFFTIGLVHGLIFVVALTGFIVYLSDRARKMLHVYGEPISPRSNTRYKKSQIAFTLMLLIGGLIFLVTGSNLMVSSGIEIATSLGVSQFTIGVTLVAVGTSLPELAATIVAGLKKQSELMLGNIIGSNIFNILFVIGGVAIIKPISVNIESRMFDFPVMIFFSLLLLILMLTKFEIKRSEGIVLLILYALFIYLSY